VHLAARSGHVEMLETIMVCDPMHLYLPPVYVCYFVCMCVYICVPVLFFCLRVGGKVSVCVLLRLLYTLGYVLCCACIFLLAFLGS